MTILFLVGRVIFGGYFLINAYNHFKNSAALTGYAQSKGVPMPKIAVIGGGVLLLIGGLTLVLGMYAVVGIVALIVFLVPVTFKMHDFWNDQDPQAKMGNRINFQKNLALIGALLMMLAAFLPYMYSF